MTQDEWKTIVKAWAAWVNGEGPPVQCRESSTFWCEWLQTDSIRKGMFSEWRVKPEPLRVRTFRNTAGLYKTIEWRGGSEPHVVGDTTWCSPWMEIPE